MQLIAAFIVKCVILRRITVERSYHEPCIGTVDDGPDGSFKGSGLAVDGAGFGAGIGACATFADPWSGPGGAELGEADASEDSIGSCPGVKYFSISFSTSSTSPARFPNTAVTSLDIISMHG